MLIDINSTWASPFKKQCLFYYIYKICLPCITGVQAYADALLVIIKVLAQNSGLDPQEAIVKLQEEYTGTQQAVGLDIKTGKKVPTSRVCIVWEHWLDIREFITWPAALQNRCYMYFVVITR